MTIELKTKPNQQATMDCLTGQSLASLYDAGFAILMRKIDVARYFLRLVKKQN